MRIEDAYIKIHSVKEKSVVCLIGLARTKEGKLPLYMISSSVKSFNKMVEQSNDFSGLNPKKDMEIVATIHLQKDDQYRTWLVFKDIKEVLSKP
jgi:hypothetical protein